MVLKPLERKNKMIINVLFYSCDSCQLKFLVYDTAKVGTTDSYGHQRTILHVAYLVL